LNIFIFLCLLYYEFLINCFMKKILVAIDFSKGSLRAFKYAIKLANVFKSDILLTFVLKPDSKDSIYSNSIDHIIEDVNKRFDELMKKHQKELKKNTISYKIREGKIHTEIANQAKYSDCDLIISGTHGVSGFEEFWIGSNARRIVTSAPCPVITIRYDYCPTKSIKRIILPIDSSYDTRQKVPYTCDLAELFKAEIHLLTTSNNVSDKKTAKSYTNQTLKYIKERGLNVIVAETSKKPSDVIAYAKDVDADLIAIMTEQEVSTISILLGASAEQVVTHSPIPVLSIHPKELYNIRGGL
jgi:nucleotide-binding universal stress UspA family protein